jgi:TusA-related sulfurtransferase
MAAQSRAGPVVCDLRGVPCPLNWAKARAELERMAPGEQLLVLTDAPRAEFDIPAAAETEGWAVLEITKGAGGVRILIER